MWVDSHVNLHGEKFAKDLDTVVTAAREAGIGTMLNICGKVSEFDAVRAVAQRYDNMYCSVGTHPHDAKDNPNITAQEIIALTEDPLVIGIGETGLDYHYNFSDADVQTTNFAAHIKAAQATQLPLIIHSRNADEPMIHMLEDAYAKGAFPMLLHCYTSGPELLSRALAIGSYVSFSGIITFKNANDIRELAKEAPEDRIMIETDCPYLAPVPFRGRRCEPSMVAHVGEALASLRGWTIEQTQERTSRAFFDLFSKAKPPS